MDTTERLHFHFSLSTFVHWRRKWQPTSVFLPGESQGQGSLVGCCLCGHTESDMTEQLHFHFSLSCIGEGNGNPLQCSCLESPRDRGAWWAAVYGVAQSWTRLKRLSSSSSKAVKETAHCSRPSFCKISLTSVFFIFFVFLAKSLSVCYLFIGN